MAETRGNPLALLELPRGLTPAELAGGFGLPGAAPLAGRIEDSFARQLDALPEQTRRLMLVAAADPSVTGRWCGGRPGGWASRSRRRDRRWRRGWWSSAPGCRFRHPLARSAAYRSASVADRQQVHAALAEVTDPQADPDRRAWHRAQAAAGPDEEVAAELERSAGRAQARGGLAAAAAFLERSVLLTADPARHAERILAAAQANMQAGAFGKALDLLRRRRPGRSMSSSTPGPTCCAATSPSPRVLAAMPLRLLLRAAGRLEPFDLDLARETYLTAWNAARMAQVRREGTSSWRSAAPSGPCPPPPGDPRPLDLLLDGLALLITDGHAAAAPTLQRAADVLADIPVEDVLRWGWMATAASAAPVGWRGLATRSPRDRSSSPATPARSRQLPTSLAQLGIARPWMGDFAGAASVIAESDSVAAATGSRIAPYTLLRLRALQGREAEASAAIASEIEQAVASGQGDGGGLGALGGCGPVQRPGPLRGGGVGGPAGHRERPEPVDAHVGAARARRGGRAHRRCRGSHAMRSSGWRRRRGLPATMSRSASRPAAGPASTARPPTACTAKRSTG